MKTVVIALNTFREGIRAKVLYNLLFFALMMVIFSYFLGQLTIGENLKVMMDVGLASISLFGVLTAIFVGIGLIYKEMEKRTVYTILSKPIHRYEFVIGKFLGLCLTLAVQVAAMWGFFAGLLFFFSGDPHVELLLAGYAIYLELALITALAIFFSSFSSPFLSALFTLSTYLIGHTTAELLAVAKKSGQTLFIGVAEAIHFFDLDLYDLKTEVVHGIPVPFANVVNLTRVWCAWIFLILLFSCVVFKRRDLK